MISSQQKWPHLVLQFSALSCVYVDTVYMKSYPDAVVLKQLGDHIFQQNGIFLPRHMEKSCVMPLVVL